MFHLIKILAVLQLVQIKALKFLIEFRLRILFKGIFKVVLQ